MKLRPITTAQMTRLYCCIANCPVCYAHRGEFCNTNGKKFQSTIHYQRACSVADFRKKFPEKYYKLRNQALQTPALTGDFNAQNNKEYGRYIEIPK